MDHGRGREEGLSAAAEALELELERYEDLVLTLEREGLDSEKSLRHAAQALKALGDSEGRLGEKVTALVAAIGRARERQQSHASSVQERADRIRERGEVLSGLLQRFEALGRDAAEVTQLVQRTSAEKRDSNGGSRTDPDIGAAFQEVDDRLTRLADEAQHLSESAQAEHFGELARQGEGLRAQVLSARNKLRLARNPG